MERTCNYPIEIKFKIDLNTELLLNELCDLWYGLRSRASFSFLKDVNKQRLYRLGYQSLITGYLHAISIQ